MTKGTEPDQIAGKKRGYLSSLVQDHPVVLLLFGAILLLLGIVLKAYDDHFFSTLDSYFSIFLKEIGFAAIIAYFVTVGIEAYQRDSHNKHVSEQIDIIKQNVFEAVYKTRQDAELIALLEQEVFRKSFSRTGYDLQMNMEFVDCDRDKNSDSMLRIDVTSSFYVTNRSSTPSMFHFSTFLERPFDEELDHKALLHYLKVGPHVLTKDEIDKADKALADTKDFRRYQWLHEIKPNEKVFLVAKYTIFKRARDAMVWQVTDPCDGLKLAISHPKDIVIYGDAVHPCQDCAEKSGGEPDDKLFDMRIDLPLLPKNGIQVWWTLFKNIPEPKVTDER